MLSLEEAQGLAIGLAPYTEVEARKVADALGLAMAGKVTARRTQPAADLSAMDGYAIAGSGPWQRVGESRAGTPFDGALAQRQCVRISTGALMPEGGEAVLIQENARVEGDVVHLAEGENLPVEGQHVRRRGFDFAQGDMVLASPGEPVGAGQLALMLAAGVDTVEVYRPARVAILECGDELCADASACGPGHIPASNGAMIEALLRPTGCEVIRPAPVRDDLAAVVQALDRVGDADIVLVSGGASVGDHDHVQAALREWGAVIHSWKVAIKPGKPLIVAKRDDIVILGLPGNPVSSFVTAFMFALPMVRQTMGLSEVDPLRLTLPLRDALPATGPRREFLRGRVFGGEVRLAGSQDSSALRALANANCLIDRPAHAPAAAPGEEVGVDMHLLSRCRARRGGACLPPPEWLNSADWWTKGA